MPVDHFVTNLTNALGGNFINLMSNVGLYVDKFKKMPSFWTRA